MYKAILLVSDKRKKMKELLEMQRRERERGSIRVHGEAAQNAAAIIAERWSVPREVGDFASLLYGDFASLLNWHTWSHLAL